MSPWNRRSFLKAGVFGAAGMAASGVARQTVEPKPWNVRADRVLRKFRDPVATVCRSCPAHCGITAFRDGDRVVQLQGTPGSPTNLAGLCARAWAGLERVYDPERVLHPMRRTGPRGSGRWERLTWAEAFEVLRTHLAKARSRVLHVGYDELLLEELRSPFRWTSVLVDEPAAGSPAPGSGSHLYGSPALAPDAARSRAAFLLGSPVLEGRLSLPLARSLMAARAAGADVRFFGSYEGVTGSLGRWERVAPGTEAAVGFGIARELLVEGKYNRGALAAGTVDSAAGLLSALAAYTPEAVEALAGLPQGRVASLARTFAGSSPAFALAPADSPAAVAAALLNHLAGAVNAPGGVATSRGPFFALPLRTTAAPERWLAGLAEGSDSADLYWAVNTNPAYDAPASPKVRDALADPGRVRFLVAMDTHWNETAQLADLFLPWATPFESWGLIEGSVPDGRSYLILQQPTTRPASEPDKLKAKEVEHLSLFEPRARPLGEARSLPDVLLSLAGGRVPEVGTFRDTREYLDEVLRRTWGPGSLDALRARAAWVSEDAPDANPVSRVSLARLIPRSPGRKSASLSLVGIPPATLPRGYANTRWGMEIAHACRALMHPDTAAALGLEDGDHVRLKTGLGEARVPVRLIQGIHPQAVALPDGLGHSAGGAAAEARNDRGASGRAPGLDPAQPGDPVWWEEAGPGVSYRALVPLRLSPEGLQDWGPVPVEVSKA